MSNDVPNNLSVDELVKRMNDAAKEGRKEMQKAVADNLPTREDFRGQVNGTHAVSRADQLALAKLEAAMRTPEGEQQDNSIFNKGGSLQPQSEARNSTPERKENPLSLTNLSLKNEVDARKTVDQIMSEPDGLKKLEKLIADLHSSLMNGPSQGPVKPFEKIGRERVILERKTSAVNEVKSQMQALDVPNFQNKFTLVTTVKDIVKLLNLIQNLSGGGEKLTIPYNVGKNIGLNKDFVAVKPLEFSASDLLKKITALNIESKPVTG